MRKRNAQHLQGVATPLMDLGAQQSSAPGVPRSEARDGDEMVLTLMYCLTAPCIGYPGWGEDPEFWEPHKTRVTMLRLAHAAEIHNTRMATEFETMLYVSSATLAAPPSDRWYHIYMWLFRRWNPEQADAIGIDDRALDLQEQEDLSRLRTWLYRRQMEHLKAKLRNGEVAETKEAPQAPDLVQGAFF